MTDSYGLSSPLSQNNNVLPPGDSTPTSSTIPQPPVSLITFSTHTPPHDWDNCKDQIQSLLKSIGRPAAHCRREGIKNLTNRLCKLQSLNPPPLAKITAIQTTLKALQDIQAKSIAIQSRVRWIEQGEQSS